MIPFNKPYMTGKELWYIAHAHANGIWPGMAAMQSNATHGSRAAPDCTGHDGLVIGRHAVLAPEVLGISDNSVAAFIKGSIAMSIPFNGSR